MSITHKSCSSALKYQLKSVVNIHGVNMLNPTLQTDSVLVM